MHEQHLELKKDAHRWNVLQPKVERLFRQLNDRDPKREDEITREYFRRTRDATATEDREAEYQALAWYHKELKGALEEILANHRRIVRH